jgi:predicted acetyltransferase
VTATLPTPTGPAAAGPTTAGPVAPPVTIRVATPADLPAMAEADGRAFGVHYTPEDRADQDALIEPSRFLLAHDGDDLVGITGSFAFEVAVPGGALLPTPGVTWVSVMPTHRRRGILRALFTAQHRGFAGDGVAFSVLTASEASIYGRFGYGVAGHQRSVEIDRHRAAFRDDVPDPGGVRFVDAATARDHAPAVQRRWAQRTPGAVVRDGAWWDDLLRDREQHRRGSALFHLACPDGYASFRRDGDVARIVDLFAATDTAHVALWRLLLSLDLVDTVEYWSLPVDDPLPHLLTDARRVRTTGHRDGVWARVIDVPAALAARTYAVEIDAVLEVPDPFLDRGGRFRLRGGPDGATCEPATGPAAATVATAALGSLFLGGPRARTLARAGLVEADEAVLRRLDAAFTADRAPQHGTGF